MIWQFVAFTLMWLMIVAAAVVYAFNAGYAAGIRYARKKLLELATETIDEIYRNKNV